MCLDKRRWLGFISSHKHMIKIFGKETALMPVTLTAGFILICVPITDCVAMDPALHRNDTKQEGAIIFESADRPVVPSADPFKGQDIEKPPVKAPGEPGQKKENGPPGVVKQMLTPPLDLSSLEKRLRETNAIGVFTKITLKNQVDDLVNQFRDYHHGNGKTTLAELRQRYDMLLLKLLSLLQDNDPTLSRTIAASREAIWSILTDPDKFAAM
jgi:hypothetical protein